MFSVKAMTALSAQGGEEGVVPGGVCDHGTQEGSEAPGSREGKLVCAGVGGHALRGHGLSPCRKQQGCGSADDD